ncbi:ubiquinone biosynthesis protein [Carnobacterium iners]|uniref:Ubiquinone biosynthesis protein n=1 Tax=Carnobacterium iners TaxID=1073423 RepID=A0A1X7MZP9_9LACT|nr:lipopolysaccharide core heptose(II) kinase RfaY [Carnobacterium iners]SEK20993.1 ubiquinone biosynthesis protein [Carnobacterium iners]SMH30377.1 ubiquinone biosynthesis protein [Carnobacterium iners]
MEKSGGERLREIATVLASYGFGYLYRTKFKNANQKQDAVSLRKAFEELGSSFIKIGQIISTRPDLLPQDYIDELSKLQDNVPPFPFSDIQRIFKEEFGEEIKMVFDQIEEIPLASASIAQVHRARMKNGEEVIVKVQRPDIEENLLRDIALFSRILSLAPNTIKDLISDSDLALKEIEEATKIELDFRNEATALLKFKVFNRELESVGVPNLVIAYVSKRVLVEEYIEGIKILNLPKLEKEGYIKKDIAEKLIVCFFSQVFKDGYFHGDPHPGNILIRDKKIVFIDFGIMGELAVGNKESLIKLLKAIVFNDVDLVMNILLKIGVTKERINQYEFYEDLNYFFETYLTASYQQINMSTLFSDILEVTQKHRIIIPTDFTMLVKSMGMLEGILAELDPEINVLKVANLYLQASDDLSLYDSISKEKLAITSYKLSKDIIGFPNQLRQLLTNANSGRAKLHIELVDADNKWKGLNKMVNRLVFALIIAALILSSAIIVAMAESSSVSVIGIVIFLGAGLMGIWLLISIIRSGTL